MDDIATGSVVQALQVVQKAIYGSDDREEITSVDDPAIAAAADAVAALVHARNVEDNDDGSSSLRTRPLGTKLGLCPNERFWHQPTAAFGSGFLVAPDILATASHCIQDDDLASILVVFGFRMIDSVVAATTFVRDEVFHVSEVVASHYDGNGADWALVRLDRAVANRRALFVREHGKIADRQSVYVIGHPSGLPAKHAGGAWVRANSAAGFFVANLDVFAANSGSPVFNSETHIVEGLVSRGEADYVQVGNCWTAKVCPDTGCLGEECTRATAFAHLIPRPF